MAQQWLAGIVGSVLTLLWAGNAAADAIDGDWCLAGAGRFSIRGSAIVTPGGTRTQGDYHRHSFSYVVPKGEANPGLTIYMLLMNENTVYLRAGAEPTDEIRGVQIWHRCTPEVSRLDGLDRDPGAWQSPSRGIAPGG
jgi:hypothetical protein